jgi:hypothetical protein
MYSDNESSSSEDMSVSDALQILGLMECDIDALTPDVVVRQYRRMALKYHPDKNDNSDESHTAFIQLTNAYDIVRTVVALSEEDAADDTSESVPTGYFDVLSQFVKSVMTAGTDPDMNHDRTNVLRKKIIEIVIDYQCVSVSMFENIDRETSVSIYQFLCAYRDTLYISTDVLDRIRTVIQSKFEDLRIYTITPTLDDMLLDKVFKLNVDGFTYLVPLWHKEVYFDDKTRPNQEILVLCEPQVDDLVCRLDENNNIHIAGEIVFSRDLLDKDGWSDIAVPGSTKTVRVLNRCLVLASTQVVRVVGHGVLRIHEKDMYNNIDRGDICVTVRFV